MSGIGLLLNTAKDALQSQQLAINVATQNIANVNTPDYSRQIPILESKRPAPYAGLTLGQGVTVTQIQRQANTFIENMLQQRQSDLSATSEKETYMGTLENIFSESSDAGLSTQMSNFWNAWQDLSNNPSGSAERDTLCQRGELLCQAFSNASGEVDQMSNELNLSLQAGVKTVNDITKKIADLNTQIVSFGVTGNANDLMDQRQNLVNQLSQYLDINYFQNDDNTMTITTGTGYPLVSHGDSYSLGFDGNNITWQSSDGKDLDITSTIKGGKMGGWIDMRDSVIPEYKGKLDDLVGSIISAVNEVHSQGVGLEGMTSATGAYKATAPGSALQSSGLEYQDQIESGSFSFWAYDSTGQPVDLGGPNGSLTVTVDPANTTMGNIQSALNGVAGGNITADVTTDGRLEIQGLNGYSFAFSGDTSNALAALGINTFFTGTDAGSMAVNSQLENNKDLIAAGKVGSSGEIASGDNSNALDMADLQYQDIAALGDTLGNYLAGMEGSIGIDSQSVSRSNSYNETMVNSLKQQRDNVSAVSIDEEMTDVIKYQQAYAAAAKLISIADQMYQTLLDTKQ
jgi:flagellar hook-associated protein 1 FlgK